MNYSDSKTLIGKSLHSEYESKFGSAGESDAPRGQGAIVKLTTVLATLFVAAIFITQVV